MLVASTGYLFSKPHTNKETKLNDAYYITFLEKAYSELYEGAWNINGGEIHHALADLLGAPTEQICIWKNNLVTNKIRKKKKVKKPEPGFFDKLMFWKGSDAPEKELTNSKLSMY